MLNRCAVLQAAHDEKVEDFGALNSARPEAESSPVAPPPETVEGVLMPPQPLRPAEACRQLPRQGLRIL